MPRLLDHRHMRRMFEPDELLRGSLDLSEPVGRHRRRDGIVVPSEQEDERHVHLADRPEADIGEPRPQRRHLKCAALAPGPHVDRKSTRLDSSHYCATRMPSSACTTKTNK